MARILYVLLVAQVQKLETLETMDDLKHGSPKGGGSLLSLFLVVNNRA